MSAYWEGLFFQLPSHRAAFYTVDDDQTVFTVHDVHCTEMMMAASYTDDDGHPAGASFVDNNDQLINLMMTIAKYTDNINDCIVHR